MVVERLLVVAESYPLNSTPLARKCEHQNLFLDESLSGSDQTGNGGAPFVVLVRA